MNPRTIRRAAERKTLKAARKDQIANPASIIETDPTPVGEPKTISLAQFTANRANAQSSTGPTSVEGKAVSSRNHTIHGLTAQPGSDAFQVLANEDQSEYDRLLAGYQTEWQPTTATEFDLVVRMTTHAWLRRRAQRLQDARLALGMRESDDYKQFEVYGRYYKTHLRAYDKAFSDLMRLRNFQMRQLKDEALLQNRAHDVQFRFESQQRKSAEHAAKMETIRLKQEAQKQRNNRAKAAETLTETPVLALESDSAASAG